MPGQSRSASRVAPSRLTPYVLRITYYVSRITHHASRIAHHVPRLAPNLAALAALTLLLAALDLGYVVTLRSAWVEIDGRTLRLRSHQATVGAALREARIHLAPEDWVEPPPTTPLQTGLWVRIRRARTLHITVDGDTRSHRTLAVTVGEALTEAGVRWIPEDRITIAGQPVPPEHPLYAPPPSPRRTTSRGGRPGAVGQVPQTLQVAVQRAVPIGVQDAQTPFTFLTTARTLGEALLDKGIVLYAADRVQPPLDTPIRAGLRAFIDRSRPVTLMVDGQVRETRTRAATVADLLKDEGVALGPVDYTRPLASDPIRSGMRVTVVRVREREVTEQEPIPFELEYRPNPGLEIDQQRIDNWGSPGVFKRSLRVRYENGIEVSRSLAREWVEKPPINRIVSYGTRIVERTLSTPEGTFTYWRKLRVLATSYTAATSGKERSHPQYGITRVGWQARKGLVAVDPNVIPLFSEMYVAGYGHGIAADTGGMILGLHIDLCYDEDNLVMWWKWTDVYLLSPPPPSDRIRYILPNYPRER